MTKKRNWSNIFNFLLLFFLLIDPTRSIFHLTEITFILFFFFAWRKIDFRYFIVFIYCLMVYFISYAMNMTTQEFENARTLSLLLSNCFLLYLLFVKNQTLKTFNYFYKSCIVMSIIVSLIGAIFLVFRNENMFLLSFFRNDKGTIMFTSARGFLGISLIGVFYRTSPVVIIALSVAFSKWLYTKRKKYLLSSIVFSCNLFFSSTRANILSTILVIGFVLLFYLFYERKQVLLFVGLTMCFVFFALFIIISLLSNKGEASYNVKQLHMISEIKMFESNWIKALLCGFGPGAMFYTSAWHSLTSQTELSYMELFRNYGILPGLGILSFFAYPIIILFENNNYSLYYKLSFFIGYLAYMFIAGTNPFLNSITGFSVLAVFYYIAHNNVIEEI